MEIESPTLGVRQPATAELIESLIPDLEGKENPYVILSAGELTYMQALWTSEGYSLEYQEKDIDHHYESKCFLSCRDVVSALVDYLNGVDTWKEKNEFNKKRIRTWQNQLGFSLGKVFRPVADFIRGVRTGYHDAKKKS